MRLSPDTLALFSGPTRRLFGTSERRRPPSRDAIVARLRAAGRPTFDAVVDFEARLGGLAFGPPGRTRDIKLGVDYGAARAGPDQPDHPDHTMVPIGLAHDDYDRLFMNEAGEVVTYVDSVVMKNRSIVTYIEQASILELRPWPKPSYRVVLDPPIGERLAGELGLRRVDAASDEHGAWWEGRGLRLRQVSFPGSWMARTTTVLARTLGSAARALAAAHAVEATTHVAVLSQPRRTVVIPEERASAAVPGPDAWRQRRGAREYPYRSDDGRVTGQVWVVSERGGVAIQQYRWRRRTNGELRLMAWDTITTKGQQTREIDDFLID